MKPISVTVHRAAFVLAASLLCAGLAQSKPQTVAAADGIPIVYDVYGEGATAVVLVHGWSCDRSYWKAQVEPLSRDFKVVTVDLPGHGESGVGRKAWTIASFGGDVATVVKALGLDRVVLVGHSMGGDVVVDAARALPRDRVKGLIWIDDYTSLGNPRPPEAVQAFVGKFRANFVDTTRNFVRGTLFRPGSDPALVERVALDMSSAPPAVALSSMESSFSNDGKVPKMLLEMKVPVIAINPDSPPSDEVSLKRYGVEVIYMRGAGHFMMMEDPARFNPILHAAVDQLT